MTDQKTEEFIKKAIEKHGNKYDYTKTIYVSSCEKVCITCPKHGDFWQDPSNHLYGYGCPLCGIEKCVTTRQKENTYKENGRVDKRVKDGLEPFIGKVKSKYGENRFDFSQAVYSGCNEETILTCNDCGETFKTTPSKILSGIVGCNCLKIKQYNKAENEFKEKLALVHGDQFSYTVLDGEVFKNLKTKINVTCSKCGESFVKKARGLLNLKGCPCCEIHNTRMTNEEFIQKARSVHGDRYDYSLVDYKNRSTKVKIICSEHGIFEQTPGNHLYGYGCLKCGAKRTYSATSLGGDEFIKRATIIHKNKYDYSYVEYKNYDSCVKITCPKHGIFFQKPSSHLSGTGCPKCASDGLKLTTREFIEKAQKIHGYKYDYSKVEYENFKSKIKIICPEHGVFLQTPDAHLAGKGCPDCNPGYSKGEKEVVGFIKGIYNGEIRENVRDLIAPKEVDIYLPELKLAFEYNGLYYHSEKFVSSSIAARDKFLNCEKQGVQLITIYEDEWRDEPETVKSMISHALGKFERIFARKTKVKKIEDSSKYQRFLEENHIQRRGPVNFAYGLYYNDELVSIMTFTLPRQNMGRSKEKDAGKIELSRFCNKKGFSVIGGASKLLKFFLQSEEGKEFSEVYSYSDNRISKGNLYKAIGFKLEKEVSINYFYTDFVERKRKQSFRKSRFKEKGVDIEGKTEKELAEAEGWYKIYDCGKRLWTLKINKKTIDKKFSLSNIGVNL